MRWLRATWGSRLVAGGLLCCLTASVFATGVHGGGRPVCVSYAEWLRAQLRVPADAALEEVFDAAVSTKPRTLEAFLDAFVAAYEARHPQAALATAFLPTDGVSNEALVAYLETLFNGVGAEGVPVRATFLSMPVPTGKVPDRHDAAAVVMARPDSPMQVLAPVERLAVVRPLVRLIHVLSSAQPLGP